MYLIEIVAAIDGAGTLQTFYLSDIAFVTEPADTPPHVAFSPVLTDPGSIGLNAYADGKTTGGATALETGTITINNNDGQFDDWLNYSVDGRPITIRYGTGGAYPGDFTTVFSGTMESIAADWTTLTIALRDKQYLFSTPALVNLYGGTNVLPNGLDGTPTDLQGKPKPRVFGTVFNVPAVQVNTSKLTYQVNDGPVADIPAVYDRGAAFTKGVNYATSALMQAATPAAGSYVTCFAEGFFRLGTTASGELTADVTQGATAAARTVAQVLKALALLSGLPTAQISASDIATLDAANSAVVGIWLDDDSTTIQSAMDQVAASIGAWYGFDMLGVLRLGILTQPAGAPALSLFDYDAGEKIERQPARDNNIPVWRITVNHTKIWTVQSSDLAGAVTAARRAFLALETRSAAAADTSVQTQYLLAVDATVDSLLTSATDAATEAARQLALQKIRRDIFEVPLPIDALSSSNLFFMNVIELTIGRFGLNAGKLFRLIGIRLDLTNDQVFLSLWG